MASFMKLSNSIALERVPDAAHKDATDNASSTPYQRDAAVVQVPIVLVGNFTQQHVSLGIRHNLGSVHRVADVQQKRQWSATVGFTYTLGPAYNLLALARLSFSVDRHLKNTVQCHRHRHSVLQGSNRSPLADSFLANSVLDAQQQVPSPSFRMSRELRLR